MLWLFSFLLLSLCILRWLFGLGFYLRDLKIGTQAFRARRAFTMQCIRPQLAWLKRKQRPSYNTWAASKTVIPHLIKEDGIYKCGENMFLSDHNQHQPTPFSSTYSPPLLLILLFSPPEMEMYSWNSNQNYSNSSRLQAADSSLSLSLSPL
jgi:hypothetical protein